MTYPMIAALLASLGMAQAAMAAGNPSPDEMIQRLRPTAPSMTGRGIHPVGPAAPDTSAPAARTDIAPGTRPTRPMAATTSTAAPAAPTLDLTVQFASGSAELTPAAIHTLDDLGRALSSSALAGYKFRIEGHTDTVGRPDVNKTLSDARAAKVVDYLTSKWGVDRGHVTSVGMGEEQLLVPTGPNVAQPRNRRVTVVNLGA